MGVTKVGTPVTSPDGQDSELGDGDGGTDGGRDFLGGLDTQTDVALGVTDEDDGLETGTLTGTGLLLDGLDLLRDCALATALIIPSAIPPSHRESPIPQFPIPRRILPMVSYLHDLILQLGQEEVHDLELLDGQGVQVDLLHAGDLAGLDETAELGDGLPLLLLLLSTTTAATATTATATVTTTVAARTETSTSTGSSVSHFGCVEGDGERCCRGLSNCGRRRFAQLFSTKNSGGLSEAGSPSADPKP